MKKSLLALALQSTKFSRVRKKKSENDSFVRENQGMPG
jgi:hypothetical protein